MIPIKRGWKWIWKEVNFKNKDQTYSLVLLSNWKCIRKKSITLINNMFSKWIDCTNNIEEKINIFRIKLFDPIKYRTTNTCINKNTRFMAKWNLAFKQPHLMQNRSIWHIIFSLETDSVCTYDIYMLYNSPTHIFISNSSSSEVSCYCSTRGGWVGGWVECWPIHPILRECKLLG